MSQVIFGKVDQFGCWDMERTQNDDGMQFTSNECWCGLSVRGLILAIAASDHQWINAQVEVTWWNFLTIVYSIIGHAQVYDEYIHCALMYTTDHILPVLPIKNLINKDSEPTTPHKLATDTQPSVPKPRFPPVNVLYKR